MENIDFSQITNWERLNPRKQAFCLAYVRSGVGTTAAVEAGYSANTSAKTACLLLKEPLVSGVIKQLRAAIWRDEALTLEEAQALLSQKARSNVGQVMNEEGRIDPKLVKKHAHAKSFSVEVNKAGVNVKAEMADSISAIALFAKLAGWTDKKEQNKHDVGGITVMVNWGGASK